MGAKIVYERLPDGKELGIAQADPATGEYELRLPGGQLYGIRAEATDRISENQNLDLRDVTKDAVIPDKDFTLDPIQVSTVTENVTLVLNNIFFDFDQATLKPESFPELNRIAGLMKEKSTMEIKITGHADATGPEAYNLKLSEKRARAVVNYLAKQGVGEARLSVAFLGESKPIAPNTTADGRRKNRRVEFKIIKM
jgi:outer membrane protein OmpA-like peptidoglycan-associated protein